MAGFFVTILVLSFLGRDFGLCFLEFPFPSGLGLSFWSAIFSMHTVLRGETLHLT